MIGIIVAGHGNFASEIISVVESIMGKQKCLEAVSVRAGEGEHALRSKLDAVLNMTEIDEVLILSDIFGGSVSNTCLYFAEGMRSQVAVVTGVNLPMVLKVLTYRDSVDLGGLVSLACKGGREGILDACGWLDRAR
jgi:mannose/fructose/sorbose-specific phosphotransferase system IIA component